MGKGTLKKEKEERGRVLTRFLTGLAIAAVAVPALALVYQRFQTKLSAFDPVDKVLADEFTFDDGDGSPVAQLPPPVLDAREKLARVQSMVQWASKMGAKFRGVTLAGDATRGGRPMLRTRGRRNGPRSNGKIWWMDREVNKDRKLIEEYFKSKATHTCSVLVPSELTIDREMLQGEGSQFEWVKKTNFAKDPVASVALYATLCLARGAEMCGHYQYVRSWGGINAGPLFFTDAEVDAMEPFWLASIIRKEIKLARRVFGQIRDDIDAGDKGHAKKGLDAENYGILKKQFTFETFAWAVSYIRAFVTSRGLFPLSEFFEKSPMEFPGTVVNSQLIKGLPEKHMYEAVCPAGDYIDGDVLKAGAPPDFLKVQHYYANQGLLPPAWSEPDQIVFLEVSEDVIKKHFKATEKGLTAISKNKEWKKLPFQMEFHNDELPVQTTLFQLVGTAMEIKVNKDMITEQSYPLPLLEGILAWFDEAAAVRTKVLDQHVAHGEREAEADKPAAPDKKWAPVVDIMRQELKVIATARKLVQTMHETNSAAK